MQYTSKEYGIIDLGLAPGELITGMQEYDGNVYAFTDRRVFLIKRKSRLQLFSERMARICSSFRSWFRTGSARCADHGTTKL